MCHGVVITVMSLCGNKLKYCSFFRITGFLDNWQKLEAWFSLQNLLVKVDGEVEEDTLYQSMENLFLTALYNKQNKGTVFKAKLQLYIQSCTFVHAPLVY